MGRGLLSVTAFLLLPTCFLFSYINFAHAPSSAVLAHFYVVGLLAAAHIGTRLVIILLPVTATAHRILTSTFITFILLCLVGLYAGTLIGLKYWGRVASIDLVSKYVKQAPELITALGYQPIAVIVLSLLAILLIGRLVYGFLMCFDWAPSLRATFSATTLALIAPALLSIAVIGLFGLENRALGREGEPLSLFFYPNQWLRSEQSHGSNVFRSAELQREQDVARASYVPASGSAQRNVIVIVSDALRADHMSIFNYSRPTTPGLEKLRRQGFMSLAETALAVCNESFCGLRGLASSQYVEHQAANPMTLHEVLKMHGYRVHLILSGDHTNFYGIDRIYGPVDSFFDGGSQNARYVNDDHLVTDGIGRMPQWDGKPTMIQFHLMSSHALGKRFDEVKSFGPEENYTAARFGSTDPAMPKLAANYYDRGVLQTDQMLMQIVAQLEGKGYLSDALVLITGDHGESLGERGLYSHTHSVFEEALRVPFLILSFGKTVLKDLNPPRVISQVDIAPTVLHALGIQAPASWQGAAVQTRSRRRYIDFQQAHLLGLIDVENPRYLYKHWIDTESGKLFTFDLIADPIEKVDLSARLSGRLLNEWREHLIQKSGALTQEQRTLLKNLPRQLPQSFAN